MRAAILFLAAIGSATAAPTSNSFWAVFTNLTTSTGPQSSATAFCSSYLSIALSTATSTATAYNSTTTKTITVTTATVTSTAPTVTSTKSTTLTQSTITTLPTTTTTITSTHTTTVTAVGSPTTVVVTSCAAPASSAKAKRGYNACPQPKPQPSYLSNYPSGPTLSSACKGLSIQPSTTTLTSTTSVVKTTSTTTDVAATYTTTPTTTITTTITVASAISSATTITITTTTTTTSTASTTILGSLTSIAAIPTFSVVVSGGDNNGNYFVDTASQIYDNGGSGTASTFTIDATGALVVVTGDDTGDEAEESSGSNIVFLDTAAGVSAFGQSALTCSITVNADGTCPLVCSVYGYTQNYDCDGNDYWELGPAGSTPSGCSDFTPYVLAAA